MLSVSLIPFSRLFACFSNHSNIQSWNKDDPEKNVARNSGYFWWTLTFTFFWLMDSSSFSSKCKHLNTNEKVNCLCMVTTLTDFQEQNHTKVNITYLDWKFPFLLISTKRNSTVIAKVRPIGSGRYQFIVQTDIFADTNRFASKYWNWYFHLADINVF